MFLGEDAGIGGKWGKFVLKLLFAKKRRKLLQNFLHFCIFATEKKLDDETQVPQIEN